MNEQTTKLIEQLATKLGTTTEYLWGVLIKQAPIMAITELMYLLLSILFGVMLYNIHKRLSKEDEGGHSVYYWQGEAVIFPMIVSTVIFLLFFIVSLFSIDNIINGFFNPEYWALKEVSYLF